MIVKGTMSSVKSLLEIFISENFPNGTSIVDLHHLQISLQALSLEIDQQLLQSFDEIRSATDEIISGISFSQSFDENQGIEEFGKALEYF